MSSNFLMIDIVMLGIIFLLVGINEIRKKRKRIIQAMIANKKETSAGVFCTDSTGNVIYADERTLRNYHMNARQFHKNMRWMCRKTFLGQMDEQSKADGVRWIFERTADGKRTWFSLEAKQMFEINGDRLGAIFYNEDITREKELEEQERLALERDTLTGLYKRDFFFQKVERVLKRDPETRRYMVCTDICDFKLVNEVFGKKIGDKVLVDQASALCKANYIDCVHGRLDNDHFAMLIRAEDFNEELAIFNSSMLQYVINDANYKLQILIGVYEITNPNESVMCMCEKASLAIKSMDSHCGQKVSYYKEYMLEKLVREKGIVGQYEDALKKGQIFMELQAQADREGKIVGAEALVRWNHPVYGRIMPDEFISICEKTGYVFSLDRYIWESAAKKLAQWKKRGREDLSISINISPKDFFYVDLYSYFTELVEKYDIDPKNLHLEVTETFFAGDFEALMKVIRRLQKYGFVVEIDDFGSGYSSLNLLKDISADVLKMDMVFLKKTQNEERNNIILTTMITMAKALEMEVIMEGVENDNQYQFLKELGCDFFQGYYISRPVSVEEFEEMVF